MKFLIFKYIITFFLMVCVVFELYGQDQDISKSTVIENVMLNTDREIYLCGENIAFDGFTYDANWFLPLSISSVLYVELYNQDNTVVSRVKSGIKEGRASGIINVPRTVSSDIYFIRAYTNYMKNFGPESFFTKKLRIINPFYNYSGLEMPLAAKQNINCEIFPEGGKLVSGLKNNIVCRFTGNNGRAIPVIARVIDEKDSIITDFRTYSHGLAKFDFVPERGIKYSIEAASGTNQARVLLDPPSRGASFRIDSVTTEYLSITVFSTESQVPAMMVSAIHGEFSYPLRETFITNAGKYDIPLQRIPRGLVYLKLTDYEGQKLAGSYFYNPPDKIKVNIMPDKLAYGNRDKVNLLLDSPGAKDFTVSVSLSASMSETTGPIADPCIISNELRHHLPGYENELISAALNDPELFEMLLYTVPVTVDSMRHSVEEIRFLPEKDGDIISGTLYSEGKKPAENIKVIQSFVGPVSQISVTTTNEKGEFFFLNRNQNNSGDLILKAENDQPVQIIMNEEFYPDFPKPGKEVLYLTKEEIDLISKKFINIQVADAYQDDYNKPSDGDTIAFYGREYGEYNFNEYFKLPNMKEFIFEVVKGVVVSKDNKVEVIEILEETSYKKIGSRPLILIDGIPVTDYSIVINFPPQNVKFARVVRNRYFYKGEVFDGIMDIVTFSGDGNNVTLPQNTFRLKNAPLQIKHARAEVNPEQAETGRVPLYMNLVYFNPEIYPDSTGKAQVSFYTPDNSGIFKVRCTGHNSDGTPGTAEVFIKVGQ